MTMTPGPLPDDGVARYPCASAPLLGNVTFCRGLSAMGSSIALEGVGRFANQAYDDVGMLPLRSVSQTRQVHPSRVRGEAFPQPVLGEDHDVAGAEGNGDRDRQLVPAGERRLLGAAQCRQITRRGRIGV